MDISEAGWGHPERGAIPCWVARLLRSWLASGQALLRVSPPGELTPAAAFRWEVSPCGIAWTLLESAPCSLLRATLAHVGAAYVGQVGRGGSTVSLRDERRGAEVALWVANESGRPLGLLAARLERAP